MMSQKPIQITSEHIKKLTALTYHQVGTFTLLYARWNRTTEFCKYPNFEIVDSGLVEIILDIL